MLLGDTLLYFQTLNKYLVILNAKPVGAQGNFKRRQGDQICSRFTRHRMIGVKRCRFEQEYLTTEDAEKSIHQGIGEFSVSSVVINFFANQTKPARKFQRR